MLGLFEGTSGEILQVGALVAAITAAIIAARKAPSETRKMSAEGELARVQAQGEIIDDLQSEVGRYKKKLTELEESFRADRAKLEAEISDLQRLNLQHQRQILSLEERCKEFLSSN